jgi:hypothetical protein
MAHATRFRLSWTTSSLTSTRMKVQSRCSAGMLND